MKLSFVSCEIACWIKNSAPNSATKKLLLDDVATCAWRLARAVRLEQLELDREVNSESDASIEISPTDAPDRLVKLGDLEIRRRRKLLEELRRYAEGQALPAGFEKPVDRNVWAGALANPEGMEPVKMAQAEGDRTLRRSHTS